MHTTLIDLCSIDQEWLDAVNLDRKKEQLNGVSYETFEIVMDRLEKEWFDLVCSLLPTANALNLTFVIQTKNIPKPDLALPSEDSTCAICDDSEGENSNAIVFCDGCNLAVHQGTESGLVLSLYHSTLSDCYGVPYIPEGQWLCRKCTVSPENPVVSLFVYYCLPLITSRISRAHCVQMKGEHSSRP